MRKLSQGMLDALRGLDMSGGGARGIGGGFWQFADGSRWPWANGRQTIVALQKRGLVRPLGVDSRPWRDTFELTEAGREAAWPGLQERKP